MKKIAKLGVFFLIPLTILGTSLHQGLLNKKYKNLANLVEKEGKPNIGLLSKRLSYEIDFKIGNDEYTVNYFPKSGEFPPNKRGIIITLYPEGKISMAQNMQDWGLNGIEYSNPKKKKHYLDSLVAIIPQLYLESQK